MKGNMIRAALVVLMSAILLAPASSFAQANPCGLPMEKKPAAGEKKAEKGMDKGMMDKDKGMKDDKAAKGKQGAENPCAPMKK